MKAGVVATAVAAAAVHEVAATGNPVTKVIELIKELKAKTIQDGETEQKVYDKFACWCEKTTDRKATAIETAKTEINTLGNKVLSLKGSVAQLAAEIADTQADISDNEKAQAEATSIRTKENSDFQQEKAEISQTLNALERAIKVLAGAGTGAKTQGRERDFRKETDGTGLGLVQAKAMTAQDRNVISAALSLADVKHENASLISSFLKTGYAPQSATVQGILKDMYTTFSDNLETGTHGEMESQGNFENLMAKKLQELGILQKTLALKQTVKADEEVQLADTMQSLEDTTEQMNDDAEFFDLSKKNCKAKNDAWSERKRARTEELDGLTKGLEILEKNRALFASSIKPGKETGADSSAYKKTDTSTLDKTSSFIQLSAQEQTEGVHRAVSALMKAAAASKSIKLAAIAVEARKSGHFDKVIKAIDDMIVELGVEEQDDITKRDDCIATTHKKNEKRRLELHEIKRNDIRIEKLQKRIEALEAEIEATAEAIATVMSDIVTLKDDRTLEHAAFKRAKKDDEDTIDALQQALDALTSYHDANDTGMGGLQSGRQEGLSFVQVAQEPEFEVSEDQAPDAEFSGNDENMGASKGIVSILTMIIEDVKDEVTNGVAADAAANKAFKASLKAAEKLQDELEKKKINLESDKTDTESKKTAEEGKKTTNEGELSDVKAELSTIKPGCDWLNENFSKRGEMRAAEREGLSQAKAILAGMQTSLIAEKKSIKKVSFNDKALGNAVSGFLQRK